MRFSVSVSSLCKLEHGLVGLQIGIGLRHGEEPAERLGEDAFRRHDLLHRVGIGGIGRGLLPRGHGAVAGRHHFVERAPLVRHVAFRGLDQVGDEIVPPLELHVDLRELILEFVAERDQPVVDADAHAADDQHDADDDAENEQNGD